MLDVRRIRETPDAVKQLLAVKGGSYAIDQIVELDQQRRAVLVDLENRKALRNRVSQEIAELKRQHLAAEAKIVEMRGVGEEIQSLEQQLLGIDAALAELLWATPNTPLPEVPEGSDAASNVEVYVYGTPPIFGFAPIPHWELGERLKLVDFERAHKITGSRFSVLTGWGARLSRALTNFMLDHAAARGYEEILPPAIANRDSLVGTGQFPKFEEDVFRLAPNDLYLIPTAEVPLTNLHRGEILDESVLPLKYVAATSCFRSEAGAAGRDTRGLIRQHQFEKVELVQVVRPEDSREALEQMRRDAETVLEDLGLPFRTVLLCGGDMGFSQAMTYDIEVWLPSYERYVEISSVSVMTDYQARRAEIRYRPQGSRKTELVHTLNGSALAVGRTLAAILENNQTQDGHVRIPDQLQPYLGVASI
jgi:seryl-tRNA synthetase